MIRLIFCFLFFVYMNLLVAQTFNRPTPATIYPYQFEQFDTTFHGYYFTVPFHLLAKQNDPEYKKPRPMILDENGYILLYYLSESTLSRDFKYFEEHQSFGLMEIENETNDRANDFTSYRILDSNFNTINTFNYSLDVSSDAHELLITKNGNYIIDGAKSTQVDLEGNTINGIPASATTVIRGYVIEEYDINNNLIFQWNSNDYINPLDTYDEFGYNPNNFDYAHGNAIEEDTDAHLLISFRHLNAVYKINRFTGEVIWVLGGKSSYFTFINDNGFSGQHDIRRLPNGNISLFDNGNTSTPQISRAVEYELDTTNWTAKLVWKYIDAIPSYSLAMGSHQTTLERLHLINYGLIRRPYPSISLVNDSKNVISNIYFQNEVMSYRSYIFNAQITIPRPRVICNQFENRIELIAPANHAKYAWSTGDDTMNTTITNSGIYQVWVKEGDVMIGSLPIVITDINSACESLRIEVVAKKELATYDVLGREIIHKKANQLYIILYNDNSTKKIIYSE